MLEPLHLLPIGWVGRFASDLVDNAILQASKPSKFHLYIVMLSKRESILTSPSAREYLQDPNEHNIVLFSDNKKTPLQSGADVF